jgi:hypothetical protein
MPSTDQRALVGREPGGVDAAETLRSIEREVADPVSIERLREVREYIGDPAFLAELQEFRRTRNDPDQIADLASVARRLQWCLGDRCEAHKFEGSVLLQGGMAGGIGLIGGCIVAALTATFPLVAVLPVAGGAYMVVRGYLGAKQLDQERHLYEQLAKLTGLVLEVLER